MPQIILESGAIILIGKNAKSNDRITFISEQDDLWFHANDYTGSHVVLHNTSKIFILKDIQQAANEAAYHSKGKTLKVVDIMMTQIKNIRKERGCSIGEVIVDEFNLIKGYPNASNYNKKV
uniref:NFACT RNA-binding domain-containing protein n=1 Tax=viral metagenome TaxID=1070528 RepID=A0A6C0M039_9ZZZZ